MTYVVCNKPLRSDGTLYCEFDGDVQTFGEGQWERWVCPSCGATRYGGIQD